LAFQSWSNGSSVFLNRQANFDYLQGVVLCRSGKVASSPTHVFPRPTTSVSSATPINGNQAEQYLWDDSIGILYNLVRSQLPFCIFLQSFCLRSSTACLQELYRAISRSMPSATLSSLFFNQLPSQSSSP
jgi:hypothetical protein